MDDTMVQQRDIGKLWGAMERTNGDVRELRVALVGLHGDNGLRGELRAFMDKFENDHGARLQAVEARVEEGIDYGKHLYEVERHQPGACIGKAALDAYVAGIETKERRTTDLSIEIGKSRRAMLAAILVAVITSMTSLAVALISKGGTS